MKIYQEYHENFIEEENVLPFNSILRRNYYISFIFSIGITHISLSSFDLFFLFSEFKKITKYDNEMYSLPDNYEVSNFTKSKFLQSLYI